MVGRQGTRATPRHPPVVPVVARATRHPPAGRQAAGRVEAGGRSGHVRAFTEHTRGDRHQALWLGEALGLRWEDVTLETDDGAWPHARVARQCWRSAGRPCGASPRPTRVFVSSYSIQPRSRPRHTAASRRLVAGVPLKDVSGLLGHSSLSITADTYGHVLDDSRQAADRAMAARLDACKRSPMRATRAPKAPEPTPDLNTARSGWSPAAQVATSVVQCHARPERSLAHSRSDWTPRSCRMKRLNVW